MITFMNMTEPDERDAKEGFLEFKNKGGPLALPDHAESGSIRRDLLPKPQNTWRDLFWKLTERQVNTINDLLLELDSEDQLSPWAHRNEHVLRIVRAIHQCEHVEKMAVERFNQLLECAHRIAKPQVCVVNSNDKRKRDPSLFISDLKLVDADLVVLDALGPAIRNRLLAGYLISQSSFDFKAIDLISSPYTGFDDDEMEFIRLLSVPTRAFVPLIMPQIETIIENVGIVDSRYYTTTKIPDCDYSGCMYTDTFVTVRDEPYALPALGAIRFNVEEGLL